MNVDRAERVHDGFYLLGEDRNGMLCAPYGRGVGKAREWRVCVRVPMGRWVSSMLQRKIIRVIPVG